MNKTTASITLAVVLFVGGLIVLDAIGSSTEPTEVQQPTRKEQRESAAPLSDGAASAAEESQSSEIPATVESSVAFTIEVGSLSSGQQAAIRAVGISADTLVITDTMLTCAEKAIGSNRMVEIQNGARPSLGESFSLLACYR